MSGVTRADRSGAAARGVPDPARTPNATTTIAAIASPPGSGARGVIRVSGPAARVLVLATWSGATPPDLERRSLALGRFDDGRGTQPLLLLWMPGPHSFTREDVAEFHLPGNPALLAAGLERLLALGATAAEPGEFTRRAFLSGRIDLTRAEGVLALVRSTNAAEARAARALLFGGLEARVSAARATLVDARTLSEASLDFDQNDTGHVPTREIETLAVQAELELAEALGFEIRRAAADGLPRVVLFGAPNAGKSALFNALALEDAALVSRDAGTTRDALECVLDFDGLALRLIDTAGIDEPSLEPDREAQRIAGAARAGADLVLWVVDAENADPNACARERAELEGVPVCLVWNKSDLAPLEPPAWTASLGAEALVRVSAATGEGLENLWDAVGNLLARRETGGLERETFERHRRALDLARAEVGEALARLRAGLALELAAEHLRRACEALDALCGATTPEDVLDRIFARFCLGK